MRPSRNQLWREVLERIHGLEDGVRRAEAEVDTRLDASPARPPAATAQTGPPHHAPAPLPPEPPPLSIASAPRLVAVIRRGLDADPLRALDLSYPPGLFAAGVRPDRLQRECMTRHAVNCARLAMYVASRHGYRASTVEVVGLCALLHDVGMERQPPELFVKATPLTPGELRALQAHSVDGACMVRASRQLDGLLQAVVSSVVRQHHERADGSGYPEGLDEPHIHEFARLLALVEAYETMVSPRPYKAPRLPNDAMETLLLEAFGKRGRARFDRRIATTFVRALSLYPIGSAVRLASGETAQVVAANPDDPAHPHVRLVLGPDGQPLRRPRVVDLSQARADVAQAVPLPRPTAPARAGERGVVEGQDPRSDGRLG